jgi:valyl-tRNA synthetase
MNNIQDWCISRQLWWGHRIPAWYDSEGRPYVGRSEEEVRTAHGLGSSVVLTQDEDVLDTWFSSALWPFSTLGWPQQTVALKTFYPSSVLVTGFDIIFFWVARMIMFGLKFAGDVPFREVYITGLIRDENGDKMSKSKGNIIDPLDLIDGIDLPSLLAKRTTGLMQPKLKPQIEKATKKQFPNGIPDYGTDALRFTFAALASTGRDIRFDLNRIEGYRNFCNKIWNAARFVLMNVEGHEIAQGPAAVASLNLPDRWILSRLSKTIEAVEGYFTTYRFDLAARALYEFIWNEYCDWYLELTKPILQNPATPLAEQAVTRRTLVTVLEALLRASHPFMPFITEEIWQRVAPLAGICGESIMLQSWPDPAFFPVDDDAEAELGWIQGFILGVRQIRGEMDIPPGKRIPVLLQDATVDDVRLLAVHDRYLRELARLASIETLSPGSQPPPSATALVGSLKLLVPIAGLIDVAAERARLAKNRLKVAADLERVEQKLATESFTSHAPEAVVAKERERQEALRRDLAKLDSQLDQLASL